MVQGIYFDTETRSFSLIESTNNYSIDPVTGETISPKEYGKRMRELNGGKQIKSIKDGKVTMDAGLKGKIAEAQTKRDAVNRTNMLKKAEFKKVSHSDAGRQIAAKAHGVGKTQGAKFGTKKGIGYGLAGAAAVGAAGYGIHKLIQKRKAKKAQETA